MQICENNIDKVYDEFRACMSNKELMLLYAAMSTVSDTVVQEFISANFPSYESTFYVTGDMTTLAENLQQMLTQNGFIGE